MTAMTLDRPRVSRSAPPARRPAGPAGARAKLRLTRRGRVVVVLTVLLLLVVGFSAGRVSSQASSDLSHRRPPTVTVQPGETLWQLATRVAPHTDPRLVVTQIEQINHLPGAQVFAGQQLIVPS